MPHLLYSSIDGHLGCFRVLAIMNNAAVNTGVHISFPKSVLVFPENTANLVFLFPLESYPEVELLDPSFIFNFFEEPLFSLP